VALFHDGRRRRWADGGRAARKERRTSAEEFDAGCVVAEVAGGIAMSSRRLRRVSDMCVRKELWLDSFFARRVLLPRALRESGMQVDNGR
jgi:hypothetical protein